jgi:hypothetical protein
MRSRPESLRLVLWVSLACGIYLLLNHLVLVDLVQQLRERTPLKSALYVVWIGAGLITCLCALVFARRATIYPLALCLFASTLVNYGYLAITGEPLSVDVIQWLPHELGQLRNAGAEYATELAAAVVGSVCGIGALLYIRLHIRRLRILQHALRSRRWRASAIGAFLLYVLAGLMLQPPMSAVETNVLVYGVPSLLATPPDVRPVLVDTPVPSLVDKVVLIVDESVSYEAFNTLVARRISGLPVTDFGEAAATANCSAASNALLRWGVEKKEVKDAGYDPRTNPMIWSYAKGAGYRTVLIDGQSTGQVQNFISPKEYVLIDEFVPALSDMDTDERIAHLLNERLSTTTREFIYIVKRGAHFPYEMNYPSGLLPEDASRESKYAAAVSYSTGRFFDTLRRDVPVSNVLMIYTSDHGQDHARRSPHCNADPAWEEYSVPLVAITASHEVLQTLSPSTLANRASHLNIFPSLLRVFGYSRPWIEMTYGASLSGPTSHYLTYIHRAWQPHTPLRERHTVRPSAFRESEYFPGRRMSAH